MIKNKKWRVKGLRRNGPIRSSLEVMIAVVGLFFVIGCTTTQERQARQIEAQTYEIALLQEIQSYIYEMGCPALMPMAADLLWEAGYEDEDWEGQSEGLVTDWKIHDEMRRTSYEVMSREVGPERCTVQFVRNEEAGATHQRRRDPHLELQLLQIVDENAAHRIRSVAREASREAYQEVIDKGSGEERSW